MTQTLMFRAEITVNDLVVRVEVGGHMVDAGEPGYFDTARQAWENAAGRLEKMSAETGRRAASIKRMLREGIYGRSRP